MEEGGQPLFRARCYTQRMKRISSPIQGVHDCLRCLVLLPTLLALPSCEVAANLEMETNLPARPNPTAWVFDRPLNEVVEAIRAAHGDYALARGEPEQIGEIPFASVADILNVRGNEHDFYLWHPRHPYGWSEAYRSSSGPLPYRADFHLHLFSPSPTRTSVEVRVIRPQVHAWAWRGPPWRNTGSFSRLGESLKRMTCPKSSSQN